MKALAALATLGLAVAICASDADAEDKTARLTDPATPGALTREARLPPVERRLDADPSRTIPSTIGLSDVELNGIRAAIRGQLVALAARDADKAFSYLAPGIQDFFAKPAAFLRKLTADLKPLANATGYAFADIEREATDAIQSVVLADGSGQEWLARFTMERQPDGRWGIKRCIVEPSTGNRI